MRKPANFFRLRSSHVRHEIGSRAPGNRFFVPAQRAEEYACFFAARKHARLTVISVLEFAAGMDPAYPVNHQYLTERMQEASVLLTEAKQRIANRGISASTRIETGPPSEAIVAAALTEAVDFIVLGTSGRSGLAHVLLGSTAERVISRAPCPVLAVRSTGGTEMALKRILVPIDFLTVRWTQRSMRRRWQTSRDPLSDSCTSWSRCPTDSILHSAMRQIWLGCGNAGFGNLRNWPQRLLPRESRQQA